MRDFVLIIKRYRLLRKYTRNMNQAAKLSQMNPELSHYYHSKAMELAYAYFTMNSSNHYLEN
jgi:hypothetical protein